MKQLLWMVMLLCISITTLYAQEGQLTREELRKAQKGIIEKMNKLCFYIETIGTNERLTALKRQHIDYDKKVDLMNNEVPVLFFNYDRAPRRMIVTRNKGTLRIPRVMRTYFNNLLRQSQDGKKLRKYELSPVDYYLNGKILDPQNWHKEGTEIDGCEVWVTEIPFDQTYTVVSSGIVSNPENPAKGQSVYTETERKTIKVYCITDGKVPMTLLGDINKVNNNEE